MVGIVLLIGLALLGCYFFYLLFLLWQAVKQLLRAGEKSAAAFTNITIPKSKSYIPVKDPYTDPFRVVTAQMQRAEIRNVRQQNRFRRLQWAQRRWQHLTSASFGNIDAQARQAAKEFRQK